MKVSFRVTQLFLVALLIVVVCKFALAQSVSPSSTVREEVSDKTLAAEQTGEGQNETKFQADQSQDRSQDKEFEGKESHDKQSQDQQSQEKQSQEKQFQTKQTPDKSQDKDDKSTDPQKAQKKPKRGSFVVAPIPISSPAVGQGLILAVGYVFQMSMEDKKSPPSVIGVAGAFTNNGSRGGGLAGRLYFSENKYQTTFLFARGRVNFDFFGIGRISGEQPISVPLQIDGKVFFGEFLRNVWHDVFVGIRYQHRDLSVSLDGVRPPGGFEIPAIDIRGKSVALGFHIQRDKRDNTFYPTTGSLFNAIGDFFDQSLGSRRQYQTYKFSYNHYHSLSKKQVVAARGMICSANQNVPFYDLCFYGANNDIRGYTAGEFQNRRMFATQAEFRQELKGRFGFVAFGGFGGIARRWNEFRSDQLLPAVGAGLRFTIQRKNHINYRVDYAVGREGHTIIIGIGEAF